MEMLTLASAAQVEHTYTLGGTTKYYDAVDSV